MFSLMGNCMSWMKQRKEENPSVTIAILGLDNAGKSVALAGLKGDTFESIAPTVGFVNEQLDVNRFDVKLYDLGGGKKIRDIWCKYYADIHGAIFMIDSTDHDRMEESKKALEGIIEDPKMSGKPILLLANKQDVPGAMDELDICQNFNLEELVNLHKSPCRLETCIATKGTGRKQDKPIKDGTLWLLQTIKQDYEQLNARVEKDIKTQNDIDRKILKERRERIRREREEREKENPPEEEVDDDIDGGDPFKRVDVNELKAKEAKAKEQKKKEKERKRKEKELNKRNSISPEQIKTNKDSDDNDDDDDIIIPIKRSPRRSVESVPSDMFSAKMNGHTPNKLHTEDDTDDKSALSDSQPTPRILGQLAPLELGEKEEKKKKKKQKKKVKKNKVDPIADEDNMPPIPAPRGGLAPLRSVPQLEPISERANNIYDENEGDIKDLFQTQRNFIKHGPNMDNDDDIVT